MKFLIRQYLNLLNLKNWHKGFTQTELLFVVILIGIVPTFITLIVGTYYRPTFKPSSNTIDLLHNSWVPKG